MYQRTEINIKTEYKHPITRLWKLKGETKLKLKLKLKLNQMKQKLKSADSLELHDN